MAVTATVGQILVNQALPPEYRNYSREWDAKTGTALLKELADKLPPEKYREVVKGLMDVGREVSYRSGALSFNLEHFRANKDVQQERQKLKRQLARIVAGPGTQEQKDAAVIKATDAAASRIRQLVMKDKNNPLVRAALAGARGNPTQLRRLIAGDFLYTDQQGRQIPVPAIHGFAEGVTPAEFFFATFGARKGLRDTKFSTADSGFLSKQMNQIAHKLMVVDGDDNPKEIRGLPVDVDDEDNIGTFLAAPAGGFPRNTELTPQILTKLKNKGIKRILVRSPLTGGSPDGGLYAKDVGVRERGRLPAPGELVGIAASQALAERMTQGMLSSKHSGGVGTAGTVSGFQYINQLLQVPKVFRGGATHAQDDGIVSKIEDAPAGGKYVYIGKTQHYVPAYADVKVKKGQTVEAGDVLSSGIPNPAELVKHKGIGEGSRQFAFLLRDGYRDSGVPASRRNTELLARGLVDRVEITKELEDYIPGDIVPYSQIAAKWRPRTGTKQLNPKQAKGLYLERPVLHYSIGTKVRPSVIKEMQKFGVKTVEAHPEPPPFTPVMVRAMQFLQSDPDWLVRMLGGYQERGLLESTYRGRSSDLRSTSFVPAMAESSTFGKEWPDAVIKPPKPATPQPKPAAPRRQSLLSIFR